MRRLWVFMVAVLQWNILTNAQNIVFLDEDAKNKVESTSVANKKCGYSNPGAVVFRVQDGLADFGEFPWMVAIIKKSTTTSEEWSKKSFYVGAGSIIHPSVILTAAHWIKSLKADEIKSRAGEWDTSNDDESYGYQERDVRKIVIHPDYFRTSMYNDVGLLFLEKPYELMSAPHIGPVCISQSLPDPLTNCFGMGWGSGTKTSNVLKKLTVKPLSREVCEAQQKTTRLGDIYQLHDSLICASSSENNCKGDGGAPLVCPIKGESTRYILYGMSAYRINDSGAPCVYVNVPQFYEWIGQRMSEEGLNSDSYTM